MKHLAIAAVFAFGTLGTSAHAVGLDVLSANPSNSISMSLTNGVFLKTDNYSFTDSFAGFGPPFVNLGASAVDVTGSVDGSMGILDFSFGSAIDLSTESYFEFIGSFLATTLGGSIVDVDVFIDPSTTGSGDAVAEASVSNSGGLLGQEAIGFGLFSSASDNSPTVAGNPTSFQFDWFFSGEAASVGGPGTLSTSGFKIKITTEADAAVIPLPATLPLLLAGLGGIGLLARRRSRA